VVVAHLLLLTQLRGGGRTPASASVLRRECRRILAAGGGCAERYQLLQRHAFLQNYLHDAYVAAAASVAKFLGARGSGIEALRSTVLAVPRFSILLAAVSFPLVA